MDNPARGLHDDPLSAASTGLLALGIERSRRAEALELLGAMIDLADADGHVLLDGALFAVEQRMGVEASLEVYTWLESIDVARRTGSGWIIPNYGADHGPSDATVASLEVLRRHLDSVGVDLVDEPVSTGGSNVVAMSKWRRAVPMAAAGIAASVAVVAGVAQFVPQAAVTTRNVAIRAEAPSTPTNRGNSPVGAAVAKTTSSIVNNVSPSTSSVTGAIVSPTTAAGPLAAVACALPKIVTTVTKVDLVRLTFAGPHGETLWGAVVSGTATLSNTTQGLLLPGLSVIAHVIDGDTDPVLATLTAPILLPEIPMPFSVVIALGKTKPTIPVTASATATGLSSC